MSRDCGCPINRRPGHRNFHLRDPDGPIARLPRSTEAERLVVQGIGQHVFRDALLD